MICNRPCFHFKSWPTFAAFTDRWSANCTLSPENGKLYESDSVILIVDNYDSFVHNLSRYCEELGCETTVERNDAINLDGLSSRKLDAIIISPGPCTPEQAGVSVELVRRFHGRVPILGVCLGHQSIAAAFGADVIRAPEPVHGRISSVAHEGTRLFNDIPSPFTATRYHSLVVDDSTLPDCLQVTARTSDGIVMAVEHRTELLFGVQFHPESILTDGGHQLLSNFLRMAQVPVLNSSGIQPELVKQVEDAVDATPDGSVLHW